MFDNTCQVHSAALVYVHVWSTYDLGNWLHNGQIHGDTNGWRGAHLTFVDARVALLRVLDLKGPIFILRLVYARESLVTCVRVATHGQQVDVTVSNPGDRSISNIPNPTVEIGRFSDQGCHVLGGRRIKVGPPQGGVF